LKYNPHSGRRHVLKKNRIKKQPDFVFSQANKVTLNVENKVKETKVKFKKTGKKKKPKRRFGKKTFKQFLF